MNQSSQTSYQFGCQSSSACISECGTHSLASLTIIVIYIYKALCESVSVSPIVCPRGQTICLSPGGQTFLTHRRGGGVQTFLTQKGWGGQTCFTHRGDNFFFAGGGGGFDDVDEETDVSKANFLGSVANIFVREARKLSE